MPCRREQRVEPGAHWRTMAGRGRNALRDQIGRVGVGRDQVHLQLYAVDATHRKAVHLEGAGVVMGDRGLEGILDALELIRERIHDARYLIIDDEAECIVPAATRDRLAPEIEGAVRVDDARILLE